MKNIFLIICIISTILMGCRNGNSELPPEQSQPSKAKESEISKDIEEGPEGWFSFSEGDFFNLDVRYATENNFVKEAMYECGKCYLRKEAAQALKEVANSLAQHNFKLVLFDCYRPSPVQKKLWQKVPNPNYVTPPEKGSMHNRGVAVDLTIADDKGRYLDMGTEYDFFGVEAHTDNKNHSEEVLRNRKLLNDLMVKYGFKGIRTEWWHFSLAKGSYEIADWEWDCP